MKILIFILLFVLTTSTMACNGGCFFCDPKQPSPIVTTTTTTTAPPTTTTTPTPTTTPTTRPPLDCRYGERGLLKFFSCSLKLNLIYNLVDGYGCYHYDTCEVLYGSCDSSECEYDDHCNCVCLTTTTIPTPTTTPTTRPPLDCRYGERGLFTIFSCSL